MARRSILTAIALTALAFAVRFIGFDRSVIDWDETDYLLGARALLDGRVMYVDFWDFKPPGMFLLLTPLEALFDDAIRPLRIAATLSVAATGFVISRISLRLAPGERITALFAGLFYVALISTNGLPNAISKQGLDANTEHFYVLFACLAVYAALRPVTRTGTAFLAGLSAGLAFVINYYAAADFVAAAFALWWLTRKPRHVLTAAAGMALPFAALATWYLLAGHWSAFAHAAFSSGPSYIASQALTDVVQYWGEFLYMGGLATLGAIVVAWRTLKWRGSGNTTGGAVLLVWLVLVLIVITASGRQRFHYFYHALPPLCLLGARVLNRSAAGETKRRRAWVTGMTCALLLPVPVVDYLKYDHNFVSDDTPRRIAKYVARTTNPGNAVYAYNCCSVVYYLTDRMPPTPYLHPSIVYRTDYAAAAGFDTREELLRILSREPEVIVVQERWSDGSEYVDLVTGGHRRDTTFAGGIVVYRGE